MAIENGKPKHKSLYVLLKCLLVLSHGNSDPESGFSIGKYILESMYFVKDYLVKIGGFLNAPITKNW